MSAILKRDLKTAEYLARAHEATVLAETSVLDRVREKHENAAARWRELAADNEDAGKRPPPIAGVGATGPRILRRIAEGFECAK